MAFSQVLPGVIEPLISVSLVSFFITTCQLHSYLYLLIPHELLKRGEKEKDKSMNLDLLIIKNGGLYTEVLMVFVHMESE